MGSYFGHGIEATYFMVVAIWWMFNSYHDHIKARRTGSRFVARCSYPWPGYNRVPFEAIVKLSFAIIGLLVEVIASGASFVDDNDQFRHLAPLQHISIYLLFILYAACDLMSRLGAPIPEGLDWVTGGLAFAWYGVCFTYHTIGQPQLGMEFMVHTLPTYLMYLIAVASFVEVLKPSLFIMQMARMFGLLVLGTWFWHVAGMLYLPYPFPGGHPNPRYPRDVMTNVHFSVAAFGLHLSMNLFAMIVTYLVMAVIDRLSHKNDYKYTQIQLKADSPSLGANSLTADDDDVEDM